MGEHSRSTFRNPPVKARHEPEAWKWRRLNEKILKSVALKAGCAGCLLWLLVGGFNEDTGTNFSLWPPVLRTKTKKKITY